MRQEGSEEQRQAVIIETVKQKCLEIFRRNPGAVLEILDEHAVELQSKYPDCRNYTMFHVLAGGTPPTCDKFDFPGEDSIVVFLDRLDREFPEKSE